MDFSGGREPASTVGPNLTARACVVDGPYRVCEPIAEGGMGTVYRARIDSLTTQRIDCLDTDNRIIHESVNPSALGTS